MMKKLEWVVVGGSSAPADRLASDGIGELGAHLVPILVVAEAAEERERILRLLLEQTHAALPGPPSAPASRSVDGLRIDDTAHRVFVDGEEALLTALEFRLLVAFAQRPERVLTRKDLLAEVWGIHAQNNTRTVDTHVKRLRDKIGRAGALIQSVRGVGYRFSTGPNTVGRRSRPRPDDGSESVEAARRAAPDPRPRRSEARSA